MIIKLLMLFLQQYNNVNNVINVIPTVFNVISIFLQYSMLFQYSFINSNVRQYARCWIAFQWI